MNVIKMKKKIIAIGIICIFVGMAILPVEANAEEKEQITSKHKSILKEDSELYVPFAFTAYIYFCDQPGIQIDKGFCLPRLNIYFSVHIHGTVNSASWEPYIDIPRSLQDIWYDVGDEIDVYCPLLWGKIKVFDEDTENSYELEGQGFFVQINK
jgi:hypothetical protein